MVIANGFITKDIPLAFEEAKKLIKGKELRYAVMPPLCTMTYFVSDIGEVLGSTYITLEAGEEFAITQAQCFFKDEEQINKVAELSKGDTVTIIGKCDGKSMNVEVNDCSFK